MQTRPESALGVDTEVSEKDTAWGSGDTSEGFAQADRNGARVDDNQRKDRKGSCAYVCQLQAEPRYQFAGSVVEGHEFTNTPSGVCAFAEAVLGKTSLGQGIFGNKFGQHYRRYDKKLH